MTRSVLGIFFHASGEKIVIGFAGPVWFWDGELTHLLGRLVDYLQLKRSKRECDNSIARPFKDHWTANVKWQSRGKCRSSPFPRLTTLRLPRTWPRSAAAKMRPLTSVSGEMEAPCSAREVAAEVCLETVKGARVKWKSRNLQSVLSFLCPSRTSSRHLNSTTATWSTQLFLRLEEQQTPTICLLEYF